MKTAGLASIILLASGIVLGLPKHGQNQDNTGDSKQNVLEGANGSNVQDQIENISNQVVNIFSAIIAQVTSQLNSGNTIRLQHSENCPQAYHTHDAPPVRVTVFYESICKDSQLFMRDQLHPTFRELQDIMEVDINAYGKANLTMGLDGGYTFTCHHGNDECVGNIMFGCAKKFIKDTALFQDFIVCVMNSFFPPEVGRKGVFSPDKGKMCADQLGLDYSPIDQCATSAEGQTLLHDLDEKQAQLAPDLNWVPWIIINGVWTSEQQKAAEFGLMKVICEAYTGEVLPVACIEVCGN